MRALILTQHFAPEENAPAFRWTWLADGLVARGIELDVVTASWSSPLSRGGNASGMRVHRVRNTIHGRGLARRLANETIISLKSVLLVPRLPRPDVIVVTVPPLGSLALSQVLSTTLRRPLVIDLRDTWPELLDDWPTWSDYGNGPHHSWRDSFVRLGVGMLRRGIRAVQKHASMVVVTTDSYADKLRANGFDKVLCVRNTARALPELPAHRDTDGTLRVLYLGNVGRAQMLATAVRAAASVAAAGKQMDLRIVGDGAHLSAVRNLAAALNAPVSFQAKVPHSAVHDHYAWADSILVILRSWESMSMTVPSKLYEALRSGRHVTGSVAGDAAAIIIESGAGDVVPPQEAGALAALWLALIENPQRLRRTGGAAWIAEHADPERMSDEYAAALKSLVTEQPR